MPKGKGNRKGSSGSREVRDLRLPRGDWRVEEQTPVVELHREECEKGVGHEGSQPDRSGTPLWEPDVSTRDGRTGPGRNTETSVVCIVFGSEFCSPCGL